MKQKMTIDDLALTMKKGFAAVDQKFDALAVMIKKGFDAVDQRFDKLEQRVEKIELRLKKAGI